VPKLASKILAVAALLAVPAAAQQNRPEYLRALAAGYKASFLCSDLFNAGQTQAQIEADDLQRTYPEIEPLMPAMAASIDRAAKSVSVSFDEQLPPRVAAWRPYLGCAQLPIGARLGSAVALPQLSVSRQ
jgi:hypothetical protein